MVLVFGGKLPKRGFLIDISECVSVRFGRLGLIRTAGRTLTTVPTMIRSDASISVSNVDTGSVLISADPIPPRGADYLIISVSRDFRLRHSSGKRGNPADCHLPDRQALV